MREKRSLTDTTSSDFEKSLSTKRKVFRCTNCNFIPFLSLSENNANVIINCLNNHYSEISLNEYMEKGFDNSLDKVKCAECGIIHEKKKVFKFCKECNNILCKQCSNEHINSKNTHHIISIRKMDIYCCLHKSKYNYFCKDCNENICDDCLDNEHKDHEIIKFENFELNNNEIEIIKNNRKIERDIINEAIKLFNDKIDTLKQNFLEIIENKKRINIFKNNLIETLEIKGTNYQILHNIKELKFNTKEIDINPNLNELDYIKELFQYLNNIPTNNNDNNNTQQIQHNEKNTIIDIKETENYKNKTDKISVDENSIINKNDDMENNKIKLGIKDDIKFINEIEEDKEIIDNTNKILNEQIKKEDEINEINEKNSEIKENKEKNSLIKENNIIENEVKKEETNIIDQKEKENKENNLQKVEENINPDNNIINKVKDIEDNIENNNEKKDSKKMEEDNLIIKDNLIPKNFLDCVPEDYLYNNENVIQSYEDIPNYSSLFKSMQPSSYQKKIIGLSHGKIIEEEKHNNINNNNLKGQAKKLKEMLKPKNNNNEENSDENNNNEIEENSEEKNIININNDNVLNELYNLNNEDKIDKEDIPMLIPCSSSILVDENATDINKIENEENKNNESEIREEEKYMLEPITSVINENEYDELSNLENTNIIVDKNVDNYNLNNNESDNSKIEKSEKIIFNKEGNSVTDNYNETSKENNYDEEGRIKIENIDSNEEFDKINNGNDRESKKEKNEKDIINNDNEKDNKEENRNNKEYEINKEDAIIDIDKEENKIKENNVNKEKDERKLNLDNNVKKENNEKKKNNEINRIMDIKEFDENTREEDNLDKEIIEKEIKNKKKNKKEKYSLGSKYKRIFEDKNKKKESNESESDDYNKNSKRDLNEEEELYLIHKNNKNGNFIFPYIGNDKNIIKEKDNIFKKRNRKNNKKLREDFSENKENIELSEKNNEDECDLKKSLFLNENLHRSVPVETSRIKHKVLKNGKNERNRPNFENNSNTTRAINKKVKINVIIDSDVDKPIKKVKKRINIFFDNDNEELNDRESKSFDTKLIKEKQENTASSTIKKYNSIKKIKLTNPEREKIKKIKSETPFINNKKKKKINIIAVPLDESKSESSEINIAKKGEKRKHERKKNGSMKIRSVTPIKNIPKKKSKNSVPFNIQNSNRKKELTPDNSNISYRNKNKKKICPSKSSILGKKKNNNLSDVSNNDEEDNNKSKSFSVKKKRNYSTVLINPNIILSLRGINYSFASKSKINSFTLENKINCLLEITPFIFGAGNFVGNIQLFNIKLNLEIQNIKEHIGKINSLFLLKDNCILSTSTDFKMKKIKLTSNFNSYIVDFVFIGYNSPILKGIELTFNQKIICISWKEKLSVWIKSYKPEETYINSINIFNGEAILDIMELSRKELLIAFEKNLGFFDCNTFECFKYIKNIKISTQKNSICRIDDNILGIIYDNIIQLINLTNYTFSGLISMDQENINSMIKLKNGTFLLVDENEINDYCIINVKQYIFENDEFTFVSSKKDQFYNYNRKLNKKITHLVEFSTGIIAESLEGEFDGKFFGEIIVYE